MQALDLYATIEEYLDFEEEIEKLYQTTKDIVIQKNPKTLIDIGCGQGEFCKLIQTYGIDTLGVDLSEKQIQIANEKGINAKYIDIEDVKEKYDCATAVFDVVNYLPNEYIKTFLTNSYNLLNENGYFIFDINSLYGFEEVAQGALTIDEDDNFIAIDANFVEKKLFTDITLFSKTGKNYKKDFGTITQYYYTNEELKNMLTDIGFAIEEIKYFNLHDSEQSDKYIFICKKEK